MIRNFETSLSRVLEHEGGFVDHPRDPGGATNKGVTLASFRRFVKPNGTVADLKRITDAQVAIVYRKNYWNAIRGDDLPDGVDYATFDFAVNSGPDRAAKFLQGVLGVNRDGKIGAVTITAAKVSDAGKIVSDLCDDRMDFLKRLGTWKTFGKGWSRRVAEVREHALALTRQKPAPIPPRKPTQPTVALPGPVEAGWLSKLLAAFFGLFARKK